MDRWVGQVGGQMGSYKWQTGWWNRPRWRGGGGGAENRETEDSLQLEYS